LPLAVPALSRYRPDDETSAKTVAAAALIVDERARHRCHFDADRWQQEKI